MAAQSQPLNTVLVSAPPAQDRFTTCSRNPNPRDKYLHRFELFLTFLVIISTLLMAWFFQPRMNELSSYTVSSATVNPFNISSSRLTAPWNIYFYVKNYHTRIELKLAHVQSSIYYGSHLLSQVSIPPFYVHPRGHVTFQAHLESLDVDAAESMVRERLLHGAVDFRVELLARVKYMGFLSDWSKFRISCENVTFGFPAATDNVGPGIMLGPPRRCKIFVDEKPKKRQ